MGLSEYSNDPVVQRRVGRMLSHFGVKYPPLKAQRVVNSIQTRFPDKL